jgi:MFS family permease
LILNIDKTKPKIFPGWWIVFASSVIGFLGVGIANAGLSVLFKPIAAELDLSRAAASWAAGIQSLGQGISGLMGGRATDRFGPRRIVLIGVVLLVAGLLAMFFIKSLWGFLIAWGLLVGIGFSFGCTFVTDTAIVKWFVRKSGIAINIKFAAQGLSGLCILPVIAWLTNSQGWRFSCVIAAIVIAVVCLPLTWFLIKPQRPEYYGLLPDGDTKTKAIIEQQQNNILSANNESDEYTFKQTLSTFTYWLLTLISYLAAVAAPIMGVHCIPFLTDRGIAPVQAAGIMAITLTAGIPARLITGFILDRVKTINLRFIIAAGFMVQAVGVVLFLISNSTTMIYVWFFMYGVGNGMTQGVVIPLWARYFGRKAYGAILGSTMAANVPIAVAAPVLIGWIYDRSGSYTSVIIALAVSSFVASIISVMIRPPKKLNPSIS